VFSLNVPVPHAVSRRAAALAPALSGFDVVRHRHTLVCKRLGEPDHHETHALEKQVRNAIAGTGPFAASIQSFGQFEDPPNGASPVIYFEVESPGLQQVHDSLLDVVEPVPDMEGPDYDAHVTLARGGSRADTEQLLERSVEPLEWTVDELVFFDARHEERAGSIALPA